MEKVDFAILSYNLERFPKLMEETLDESYYTSTNVIFLLTKSDFILKYLYQRWSRVMEFEVNTKLYMENLKEIKNSYRIQTKVRFIKVSYSRVQKQRLRRYS